MICSWNASSRKYTAVTSPVRTVFRTRATSPAARRQMSSTRRVSPDIDDTSIAANFTHVGREDVGRICGEAGAGSGEARFDDPFELRSCVWLEVDADHAYGDVRRLGFFASRGQTHRGDCERAPS